MCTQHVYHHRLGCNRADIDQATRDAEFGFSASARCATRLVGSVSLKRYSDPKHARPWNIHENMRLSKLLTHSVCSSVCVCVNCVSSHESCDNRAYTIHTLYISIGAKQVPQSARGATNNANARRWHVVAKCGALHNRFHCWISACFHVCILT